jgi:XRE family transcriptional regulator, aerobic/anaerobic benzoate catabolism transcriptional regulator
MPTEPFLLELGRHIRALRLRRGLSQEQLAQLAGLSPRYVSQIEAGRGNVSILRLLELSDALAVPLPELVRIDANRYHPFVALLGLRGAGKSTVGRLLAKRISWDFAELDGLIEEEAGLGLDEIFALHGERYYRRLEREVLARLVSAKPKVVLATGGSLVTDRVTYDLLKAGAVTVWLRARPEQHLERVAAQGDRRPMAGHADPLTELRSLLRERDPLYGEADVTIDTSEKTIEATVEALASKLRENGFGLTG